MTKTIQLGEGLDLPAATAASQVYAFMGRRGSGKTYAVGRLVEELHDHGGQFCVVDPVGVWGPGLRRSADGKGAGIDVPVFGGFHGDLPLPSTAGKVIAELVATRSTSMVLDVSGMTGGEQRRFVADFCAELFHAKKRHRSPILVVFEEAQEFVPQHVRGDVAKMVGAVERLIKLGRNYGVGAALVSQRPQAVNKDVLNQTELMLAFQLTGPQERKAIAGWVQEVGAGDREIADELPGLKVGTCIAWSPQWLGQFGRYKILKKRTFDASATPAGRGEADRKLSPIDLGEVEKAMAKALEEAKANDPRELQAEVARLRAELGWRSKASKATKVPTATTVVQVPAEIRRAVTDLGKEAAALLLRAQRLRDETMRRLDDLVSEVDLLSASTAALRETAKAAPSAVPAHANGHAPPRAVPDRSAGIQVVAPEVSGEPLSKAARALLTAIAQQGGTATDAQISILSGYSITSSSFANARGELRSRGLIDGPGEARTLTDAGRRATEGVPPAPTGRELLDWWSGKLGKCERTMLGALYEAGALTKEQLSEKTGYSITSSSFANGLGTLRSARLIQGGYGADISIAESFR